MNKTLARIKVIFTALPTYMTAVTVAVTALAPLVASMFPDNAESIVKWAAIVVGGLGTAIATLRRVTPVLPSQRGVLPQGPPAPPVVPIKMDPPIDTHEGD